MQIFLCIYTILATFDTLFNNSCRVFKSGVNQNKLKREFSAPANFIPQ